MSSIANTIAQLHSKNVRVENPRTGRKVTIRYALGLAPDHPAHKAARALLGQHTATSQDSTTSNTTPKQEPATRKKEPSLSQTEVLSKNRKTLLKYMRSFVNTDAELQSKLQPLLEFGYRHLKGQSPIDIATDYVSIFGPIKINEIKDFYMYHARDYAPQFDRETPIFTFSLTLHDGTKLKRTIFGNDAGHPAELQHDLMVVSPKRSIGGGLAKEMLRKSLSVADNVGAKKIRFYAGLSSGGYVWAKYGGIPESYRETNAIIQKLKNAHIFAKARMAEHSSKRQMADLKQQGKELKEKLSRPTSPANKRKLTRQAETLLAEYKSHKRMLELIRQYREVVAKNPRTEQAFKTFINKLSNKFDRNPSSIQGTPFMQQIANMVPFGPLLLLGSGWEGYFDLTEGSPGRTQFIDAIK